MTPQWKHNLHDAVQSILVKRRAARQTRGRPLFYGMGGPASIAGRWRPPRHRAERQLQGARHVRERQRLCGTDDVAKAPWLYNPAKREWISYDDPQSIRIKRGCLAAPGGAMFWELGDTVRSSTPCARALASLTNDASVILTLANLEPEERSPHDQREPVRQHEWPTVLSQPDTNQDDDAEEHEHAERQVLHRPRAPALTTCGTVENVVRKAAM
jgi:hypothetical protein